MIIPAGERMAKETESPSDLAADRISWRYLFRADDRYRGGPMGKVLGTEADAADIQDFDDHVLRKESRLTSRFSSFTTELKIAARFTSRSDYRAIRKVEWAELRSLESREIIRLWAPDQVFEAMRALSGRPAKPAGDVRAAMRKNREILIEGQFPAELLLPVNE